MNLVSPKRDLDCWSTHSYADAGNAESKKAKKSEALAGNPKRDNKNAVMKEVEMVPVDDTHLP